MKNQKTIIAILVVIVIGIIAFAAVHKNSTKKPSGNATHTMQIEMKAGVEAMKNGKYPEAISHYDKAIGVNSKDPHLYFGRGQAKLRMGDYKGAYDDIAKAHELDPKFEPATRMYENLSKNSILKNPDSLKKAKEAGLKRYGNK